MLQRLQHVSEFEQRGEPVGRQRGHREHRIDSKHSEQRLDVDLPGRRDRPDLLLQQRRREDRMPGGW